MDMKTLTGSSVQAALAEARLLLGDDVMLLESVAARGDEPARITVMVDEALAAAPALSAAHAVPEPVGAASTGGFAEALLEEKGAARPARPAARPAVRSAPRPRLFTPEVPPADALAGIEALLNTRLAELHHRLNALEAGQVLLHADKRWIAHPLYAELLASGLRSETVDRLFQAAADLGVRADDRDPDTLDRLRWALMQALRDLLDRPAPASDATGTLVLFGPSGAGKTTLLLKLARHPGFFGRRRTAALSLTDGDPSHQSPAALYDRFDLPVRTASTPEEVRYALAHMASADQIIVDTPPLHPNPAEARKTMAWLAPLLAEIGAFDAHLVLDATRALGSFDAAYLQSLPVQPVSASLTRLDEVAGWGRIAEWMLALDLPVQFASTGPGVPDGVRTFSPGWFVEQIAERAAPAGGFPSWS